MENKTFEVTEELYASQGKRFLNYIIDTIIIYAILFCLAVVIAFIGGLFGKTNIFEGIENISTLENYAIFFLIMLPYFILMETFFSTTFAKHITATLVVMKDGSKPKITTIFKRTLCRIIPFDGFSYLGTPSRGWHDSLSDTYVVDKKLFEAKKNLFYAFDEIGTKQE